FFQAEDGIRDATVTGVQTCALPIYRHALGKTITETDNELITMITLNTQQLHFNSVYARHSEFGKILVNSTLTLALVTGLTVSDRSEERRVGKECRTRWLL